MSREVITWDARVDTDEGSAEESKDARDERGVDDSLHEIYAHRERYYCWTPRALKACDCHILTIRPR